MAEVSGNGGNKLDPLGQVFHGLYLEAWRLYGTNLDEAEALCRRLLAYPELGPLHKAGCHYMLGCGHDNYLEHAQKAVEIYANLYEGRNATAVQIAKAKNLETVARKSLAKAMEDHERIEKDFNQQVVAFTERHGRAPTNEELVNADMAKTRQSVEAYFEAVDKAWDKPDDAAGEDDDDPNEDFPYVAPPTPTPSPPPSQATSGLGSSELGMSGPGLVSTPPQNSPPQGPQAHGSSQYAWSNLPTSVTT